MPSSQAAAPPIPGGKAMNELRTNRLSGHVVLGLSLFAMSLVVGATVLTMLGRFNPSPDGDEGTAAHLFQLTIVLLLPAGLTFVATANWQRPWDVAKRLVMPAAALVVAFSTLYYMEHLR
jgi:hypothetical protein